MAVSIGRAFQGVGLRLLACWEGGFESRRGHGSLFFVSIVCCEEEVSATNVVCLSMISRPRQ